MLVSINWIQEFVDLKDLDIENLIKRFTLSTAEVEKIFYKGNDFSGVVVAKIISVKNHPESKKLNLLKVDIGEEVVNCVCAAPNVKAGMITAFAKIGADVCKKRIEKIKLAGFESCGMCCSEAELGLSSESKGIIDLNFEEKLGSDIKKTLNIEDVVFEIDNKSLTNRPDLWGIYGIAREFSVISGRKLKHYDTLNLSKFDNLLKQNITISSEKVLRYSGIKIENITKKSFPINMKIRLFYCGIRGINLLTDLTNYVMLETGQPMHAFDSLKTENIILKDAENDFFFTTLDNIKRNIKQDTLMVYSNENPISIAGVMGGINSQITNNTTSLFLESATFDAISIRKTSNYLSLRTDASSRYEKNLNPEITTTAISRFVELLLKIDPDIKIASPLIDIYKKPYKPFFINFDKPYVDKYTGIDISLEKIKNILESLEFETNLKDGKFEVKIPSHRATKDIKIKADLIEEITRIYGYDNFEIKPTFSHLRPVKLGVFKSCQKKIQDELVLRHNLFEVHSYIWQDKEKYKELGINLEENLKIINSSNPNHENLRSSIIPTLLSFLLKNRDFSENFGIFEIGSVVKKQKEKKVLGIALFSKTKKEEKLFFDLKNILSRLFKRIKNIKPEFENTKTEYFWQHPKNIVKINDLGFFGTLHPKVLNAIDKNSSIAFAEFDVKKFSNFYKNPAIYSEPSKFPGIQVDLSFILNNDQKYENIKSCIQKNEFLKKIDLIDVFNLGNGKESLTIRLNFISKNRTLLGSEVESFVNNIINNLKNHNIYLKK